MSAVLAIPGIESNFFTLTLLLQNLTNALANGAVYALMALTVVMIYKTTGHLNFAQGEMAMFARSSFMCCRSNRDGTSGCRSLSS